MTRHRNAGKTMQESGVSARNRGGKPARTILILYAFFAALWGLGLVLGLREGIGQALVWGLPLWFSISCIIAYVAVSLALVLAVRRHFQ